VDAFYADRRESGASSNNSRSPSRKSSSVSSTDPTSAGTSQDYSKIAELIRDSSDKTRSNSLDESNRGSRSASDYEDTIPRSKSMPHDESGAAEKDAAPSKPTAVAAANLAASDKPATHQPNVQKPNLLRKLSGGGVARTNVAPPPVDGAVCRPDPVKRDTSNQPESLETKRSIKRVVLSRDQSAVARRLKEEQQTKGLSKAKRAELLDRKLSVEINKLGLDDHHRPISEGSTGFPRLDRMTTEDVLASFIADDINELLPEESTARIGSPGPKSPRLSAKAPPTPLGEGDRVTTIDAIAMDLASGKRQSLGDLDDTLDLINEAAPVVHGGEVSGGVDPDIADKWLKGET